MANPVKAAFINELARRYGSFRKLEKSQSLFELQDRRIRLYVRYSKVHSKNQTFYGLREDDLRQLAGHPSLICLLWDGQQEPLLIPFSNYEEVLQTIQAARDGQYKAQVYLEEEGVELYLAQAGRFNVEGNLGWTELDNLTTGNQPLAPLDLTHSQVQTLLGAIGTLKGFDVWIPTYDQVKLDWSLTNRFECRPRPPYGYESISHILQEVDVVWLRKGSSELKSLFEVEHSTSIYSGLLRFNDVHLVAPQLRPTFSIVANDIRRNQFVKQLNRPTFRMNGLDEMCTFLDYINVFEWYTRLKPISQNEVSLG
jgi:hypothetical protein